MKYSLLNRSCTFGFWETDFVDYVSCAAWKIKVNLQFTNYEGVRNHFLGSSEAHCMTVVVNVFKRAEIQYTEPLKFEFFCDHAGKEI